MRLLVLRLCSGIGLGLARNSIMDIMRFYSVDDLSEEFEALMLLGLYETAKIQFHEEDYFDQIFLTTEEWETLYDNEILPRPFYGAAECFTLHDGTCITTRVIDVYQMRIKSSVKPLSRRKASPSPKGF